MDVNELYELAKLKQTFEPFVEEISTLRGKKNDGYYKFP